MKISSSDSATDRFDFTMNVNNKCVENLMVEATHSFFYKNLNAVYLNFVMVSQS